MKKLLLLPAVVMTGIGTALTYHVFENALHGAISLIWYDTFNTNERRLWVLFLSLAFSLTFFGLQHYLDPKSEMLRERALGDVPSPTFTNYIKVLLIGFFSLLAGATLGPEAILVPASMMLGEIVGSHLFRGNKQAVKILAAAGLMALFAAFFKSFFVGVLSIFFILSQPGAKFKPILLLVAIITSATSVATLHVIEAEPYIQLPGGQFHLNAKTLIVGLILVLLGYCALRLMSLISRQVIKLQIYNILTAWWVKAVIAALVLSMLYWLGGPLVEFTGNKSIMPMFDQASQLGASGLVWLLLIKITAISWSKAIGYRGGMIFPTIFLATVLVAVVQLYLPTFNVVYGVVAVLLGVFVANRSNHLLV